MITPSRRRDSLITASPSISGDDVTI